MREILIPILMLLSMMSVVAQADVPASFRKHTLELSYGYMPFNSVYSKNGEKTNMGVVQLSYLNAVNDWFFAGAVLAFTHAWWTNAADPVLAYPKKDNALMLMARNDFHWFRRPLVWMYSSISVGLDIRIQQSDRGVLASPHFSKQAILYGIRVGNDRVYGCAELGFGSLGCARFGLGVNL